MATDDRTRGLTLTAVYIESVDGGFVAYLKELPGCIAQGGTLEEVREHLIDVFDAYLETLLERSRLAGTTLPEGKRLKEETYYIGPLVPA